VARRIVCAVESEKTLRQKTRLRRTRNLDAVFQNYLEPLLYAR
jgi:hypothetical protein